MIRLQPLGEASMLTQLARGFVGLVLFVGVANVVGCGGGPDPNNLTPEQEKNIEDELKSQEELKDQPPI